MKTRKLLAVLLSLAMVIGLMTPAAMAEEEKVAKVGDVEYATLADAISAAAPGNTVTLLKNASGAGAVINKDITIDFGGNTYTFTSGVGSTGTESNGFQILKDNTVTLKNGTLNIASGSADKFYTVIQNYANLTVTDMTLDATNADKWSKDADQVVNGDSYALSINSGNVVINGATSIVANDEGSKAYAFDSCDKSANGYSIPNVTVNTSGTIDGNIEVTGGNLTIQKGSFTFDPTAYVADGYVAMEEAGGGTYGVYPAVPVSYVTGTSTNIDGQIVSPGYTFVLPAAPSRAGYTFTGWNDGSATYSAGAEYTVDDNATSVTLTAQWSQNVSSGGGGGSSSSSTTTTEKNPDGSTTTTTTNKATGAVTETTKNPDGTTGVTKTDADGNVTEVSANVPAAAAKAAEKADEPVTLPVEVEAADSSAEATEIKVNVPSTGATVEIPVENVTPGTVVVIVNADGTESIVPLTTLTEDGVVVTLEDDATIKVIDNSKDFTDVPDDYALADSIDFVSARGLFEGNTETTFNPHANTTIAQTMTVLARLSGEDFYGAGATTKGAEWATEKGLSDGTDVSKAITREQMVVMMWKLAGMPESDQALTASDVNEISADALTAMQWAVEMGILKGNLDGTINPQGNASRAHVAAFSERYVNAIAK